MNETHKRVIIEHQDRYAKDFRYVPAGKEVWGNCATFAETARSWPPWPGIRAMSSRLAARVSSPWRMAGCSTRGRRLV